MLSYYSRNIVRNLSHCFGFVSAHDLKRLLSQQKVLNQYALLLLMMLFIWTNHGYCMIMFCLNQKNRKIILYVVLLLQKYSEKFVALFRFVCAWFKTSIKSTKGFESVCIALVNDVIWTNHGYCMKMFCLNQKNRKIILYVVLLLQKYSEKFVALFQVCLRMI
jgi:hypothetical protein